MVKHTHSYKSHLQMGDGWAGLCSLHTCSWVAAYQCAKWTTVGHGRCSGLSGGNLNVYLLGTSALYIYAGCNAGRTIEWLSKFCSNLSMGKRECCQWKSLLNGGGGY
jgi:hypothetical protein